ncbi:head-tail connector protein [Neomegalonema perideroedes]|uniref:head-tail connector protein n=1 Tax=Neomegalonema perideroedes TaxID=217219 RepID=UPI0003796296|nr:phage head-tail connector protein [Neomegalonema perideroedes]
MRILAPPAVAAVTIGELKARARIDHAHEDAVLQVMLDAAILHVEKSTGRPLTPRRAAFTVPAGLSQWWFPAAPVRELIAVRADGAEIEGARLIGGWDEPRLALPSGLQFDELEVEAEIGLDPGDAAGAVLRDAILMLAADRARSREATAEGSQSPVPFGLVATIRKERYARPRLGFALDGRERS